MSKHMSNQALWLRITAVGVVASLSSGCGYLMQARDHAVPTAVPAMQAAQTLNPEAGKNRKVVAGLDGTAGANVGEAYSQTFEGGERVDPNSAFQGTEGLGQD